VQPVGVVAAGGQQLGGGLDTDAGVGSTEAAVITVLAAVHVPATEAVLLSRVMTFWAPIPAGVVSTRRYAGRASCSRWGRLDRTSVSTTATMITSSRSGASRAS
jgi:hypothetical protein